MTPLFITGTGTDVGKTLVSAILTRALNAAYWKPVQAGNLDNTDTHTIQNLCGQDTIVFPESYRLQKPASPHLAAKEEGIEIDLNRIRQDYFTILKSNADIQFLIIEGAGGLLVPMNSFDTVADLIMLLDIDTVLVSRNYLGSINHSLLTAEACINRGIKVAGWIFYDEYLAYEDEIAHRSGISVLAKLTHLNDLTSETIQAIADEIRPSLLTALNAQI